MGLNGSIQPGTERESNSGAIILNIGEQGTAGHPPPGPLGEVINQGVRTLVACEANEIVVADAHEVSVSGVFEEALTQSVRHAHDFHPIHSALLQLPDPDILRDGVLLQSSDHEEPPLASHQVGRCEKGGHGSPDNTPHSMLHVKSYDSIWIPGDPEMESIAECIAEGVIRNRQVVSSYAPGVGCGVIDFRPDVIFVVVSSNHNLVGSCQWVHYHAYKIRESLV